MVLLLVVVITPFVAATTTDMKRPKSMATGITVLVNFGNGTVLTFTDVESDNVYNATKSVTAVEATWYGDSVFVTSIAGVANDPDRDLWWQYWVNGDLGPVAANKYVLQDDDVVEWKLPPNGNNTTQTSTTGAYDDPSLAVGISVTALLGLVFLVVLYILRSAKR